ncbi:MAG: MFS transporter [Chloroflexota bacterium]
MQQTRSNSFVFWLFGMLYFVQGVVQAYQLNFFKPHMSSEGIDADRIAVVSSIALIPFIIKAIFGLLSDRISLFGMGHRKPYMMVGLVGCSAAFFWAFLVDPSESFVLLATLVVTATFAMALFDTTADAYAVDIIPANEHSKVQSFMTGGRAAGLIILSFIFGQIALRFGFSIIFFIIGVCLLLPLLMVFRVEEPTERTEQTEFDWTAFRVFAQPNYLMFAFTLLLAWTFFQGIDGLITFYMSNLGIDEAGLGNYGSIKGIGMVIGAVTASFMAARFGKKSAVILTLTLVTIIGFTISFASSLGQFLILAIVWGAVVGLHWTVYATLSMGLTDLRIAGTMFALFQMMANIGIAAGEGIATGLSDNIGFGRVFQIFALANIIVIPLIIFVINRLAKQLESAEPALN